MTFEERMERVAERHEALAITVQQIEETQQRQQKMAEALLVAMREEHVANREANRQLREENREAIRELREENREAIRELREENRAANQELRESMRDQRERIDALVNATELLFQTASRHESRIDKLERG
jgi:hypothetical protein